MLLACRDSRVRLDGYRDGTLTSGEHRAVDFHLAGCARCRRQLAQISAVDALVRSATDPQPPIGYMDALALRLSARITERTQRRRRFQLGGAVLTAASVVVAFGVLIQRPSSTPLRSGAALTKPAASGLAISMEARLQPSPIAEPTTRKPVSDRIGWKDTLGSVVWVSLAEEPARVTEWDTPPIDGAPPVANARPPDAWIALATLPSESEPLWKHDTRLLSEPNVAPIEPARRSDAQPVSEASSSGLAAFVAVSRESVAMPTFPSEPSARRRR